MVAGARRIAGGGVEERKQDLLHLVDLLVGEAAEDQRARKMLRQLRDCCSQRPGTGRISATSRRSGAWPVNEAIHSRRPGHWVSRIPCSIAALEMRKGATVWQMVVAT